MSNRQAWTLTEAVERTTASRSTIRRYREAGKFPHAFKNDADQWMFPIEDLLAAGIKMVNPVDNPEQPVSTPAGQPVSRYEDREEISRLRIELAEERARREGLERLVEAKNDGLTDLRMALRIIEAPKPDPAPIALPGSSVGTPVSTPAPAPNMVTDQPPHHEEKPRSVWAKMFGL